MSKKNINLIKIIFALLFIIIFVWKIEEIANVVSTGKSIVAGKIISLISQDERNKEYDNIDLSKYEPLGLEKDAWYSNRVVAHACGGIDGMVYSNSLEALEYSIKEGYKLIEVDLMQTADNEIILTHNLDTDAEGNVIIPKHDDFMNKKINYVLSPMDVNMLLQIMKENKDIFIILDVKGGMEVYDLIVKNAKENNLEECLDRFIVQVYTLLDLSQYPPEFKHYLLTLYALGQNDSKKIVQYCLENDIHVVTMPGTWISCRNDIKYYEEYNIKVYVHTINDMDQMNNLFNNGVWGIYTDFIKPEYFESVISEFKYE